MNLEETQEFDLVSSESLPSRESDLQDEPTQTNRSLGVITVSPSGCTLERNSKCTAPAHSEPRQVSRSDAFYRVSEKSQSSLEALYVLHPPPIGKPVLPPRPHPASRGARMQQRSEHHVGTQGPLTEPREKSESAHHSAECAL